MITIERINSKTNDVFRNPSTIHYEVRINFEKLKKHVEINLNMHFALYLAYSSSNSSFNAFDDPFFLSFGIKRASVHMPNKVLLKCKINTLVHVSQLDLTTSKSNFLNI